MIDGTKTGDNPQTCTGCIVLEKRGAEGQP